MSSAGMYWSDCTWEEIPSRASSNTGGGNPVSDDSPQRLYLAFDEREAMAGGRGPGGTRALGWAAGGLGRGGGGSSVEGVLLAGPLE